MTAVAPRRSIRLSPARRVPSRRVAAAAAQVVVNTERRLGVASDPRLVDLAASVDQQTVNGSTATDD